MKFAHKTWFCDVVNLFGIIFWKFALKGSFFQKNVIIVNDFQLQATISQTPFTRYSRLYNRFDNRLYRVNKHPTGCQTGLTTHWMFVYTIQPVVKPVVKQVWQPVWQPVWQTRFYDRVEWTATFHSTRLWNRSYNPVWQPFDNRLYTRYSRFVKPVVKRFWQPVVSCKRGFRNDYKSWKLMTGWRAYGMLAFHPYHWNQLKVICLASMLRMRKDFLTFLDIGGSSVWCCRRNVAKSFA